MQRSLLAAAAALTLLAPLAAAQSNTIPGLDVILGRLDGLNDEGRTGTFPNGRNRGSPSPPIGRPTAPPRSAPGD